MSDQLNVTMFGTGGGPGVILSWAQLIRCMPMNLDGTPSGWMYIYGPEIPFNGGKFTVYWTPPPGNYAIISPWVAEEQHGTLLISSTILLPLYDSLPNGKLKEFAKWIRAQKGGRGVGQFNLVLFLQGAYNSEKQLAPPYLFLCPSLLIGSLGHGSSQSAIFSTLCRFNIPNEWLLATIYEGHPRFRPYIG